MIPQTILSMEIFEDFIPKMRNQMNGNKLKIIYEKRRTKFIGLFALASVRPSLFLFLLYNEVDTFLEKVVKLGSLENVSGVKTMIYVFRLQFVQIV